MQPIFPKNDHIYNINTISKYKNQEGSYPWIGILRSLSILERIIFIVSGSRFDPNSVTKRDFVMSGKETKSHFSNSTTYITTEISRLYFIAFLQDRIKIQYFNINIAYTECMKKPVLTWKMAGKNKIQQTKHDMAQLCTYINWCHQQIKYHCYKN